MDNEADRQERLYFNRIVLLNQLSSMVAFLPPLFAVFIGIELTDFAYILVGQIIVLLILSFYKYSVERKFRKIEAGVFSYVVRNTVSYVIVSISIPVAIFLIDLFYRLSPVVRVISINSLFVLGLLFLLSNLPASRIKRISKPLEDSYLREKASDLSSKLGTGNLEIFVINMDKFKIANAAQMGARKFFVFVSSYLLKNLTPEENVAVIAHEFAHASKRHVLKTVVIVWFITAIAGNLLLLPIDANVFPLLSFVFPLLGFLIMMLSGFYFIPALQRRFETQADLLATEIYDGEKLISALEKISRLNMTPRDLSKHWNMDHPATAERARRIREHSNKV